MLPFSTTWMGIMVSAISQTEKTNTVWCHLYVGTLKKELIDTENRSVVARGGGGLMGEMDEGEYIFIKR